jgi:hypothetical protein
MPARVRSLARLLTVLASVASAPSIAGAQALEFTPCAGYRFGGGFFELVSAQPVDRDGAASFGLLLDVPLRDGLQVEGLFTHQSADFLAAGPPSFPPARWRVSVDHFQAGGLQEFRGGRVRPFLTGTLGLSRYAAAGDDELRFTVAAGGGVKLFPWSSLGIRLDARLFTTFVDVDGRAVACATGVCFFDLDTDVAWQAEFSAGIVLRVRR